MKDYTQVERDNAALTIREYAFGQMNMLRMLDDDDAANNLQEAINVAIAALRGPQPDPDTGLVPCGCGGVPVPYSWDETLFSGDTPCLDVTIACQKCGMGGNIWHESKLDAKNWWNTAMGWREKE